MAGESPNLGYVNILGGESASNITKVGLDPLYAGGAPGFIMALTEGTDATAANNIPAGVIAAQVYCPYDARMAVGEAAVLGSTVAASVGFKIPAYTVCRISFRAADVTAGVKIHAISATATTFETVYIFG